MSNTIELLYIGILLLHHRIIITIIIFINYYYYKIDILFLTFSFPQVISANQHGFVKGSSVQTKLLEFVIKTFDAFGNGLQTDVMCTDFNKAFDGVNHSLLLKKLTLFGFD